MVVRVSSTNIRFGPKRNGGVILLWVVVVRMCLTSVELSRYTYDATSSTKNNVIVPSPRNTVPHITNISASREKSAQVLKGPLMDPYLALLEEHNLTYSRKQQTRFLERRHQVQYDFPDTFDRRSLNISRWAAIAISEDFAFLHIWKCGGSTVALSTGRPHKTLIDQEIQQRKWFGLVRDPIDRFLSGWAECGARAYTRKRKATWTQALHMLTAPYVDRLQAWLHELKIEGQKNQSGAMVSCHAHSYPQANFLMNSSGLIYSNIAFIGDLMDIAGTLALTGATSISSAGRSKSATRGGDGLQFDLKTDRNASANPVKNQLFPTRRDLLPPEFLLELCEYYALDYYMLDYKPPDVCLRKNGGPLHRWKVNMSSQ